MRAKKSKVPGFHSWEHIETKQGSQGRPRIAKKSLSISFAANMCSYGFPTISFVCLFVCLVACLFVCLLIGWFVCLFVCLFVLGMEVHTGKETEPLFFRLDPPPNISSENGTNLEFSASIFAAGRPFQWCAVARHGVPWLRYPVGVGTRGGSCLKPKMQTQTRSLVFPLARYLDFGVPRISETCKASAKV